jgi:hypothetical protein
VVEQAAVMELEEERTSRAAADKKSHEATRKLEKQARGWGGDSEENCDLKSHN